MEIRLQHDARHMRRQRPKDFPGRRADPFGCLRVEAGVTERVVERLLDVVFAQQGKTQRPGKWAGQRGFAGARCAGNQDDAGGHGTSIARRARDGSGGLKFRRPVISFHRDDLLHWRKLLLSGFAR